MSKEAWTIRSVCLFTRFVLVSVCVKVKSAYCSLRLCELLQCLLWQTQRCQLDVPLSSWPTLSFPQRAPEKITTRTRSKHRHKWLWLRKLKVMRPCRVFILMILCVSLCRWRRADHDGTPSGSSCSWRGGRAPPPTDRHGLHPRSPQLWLEWLPQLSRWPPPPSLCCIKTFKRSFRLFEADL